MVGRRVGLRAEGEVRLRDEAEDQRERRPTALKPAPRKDVGPAEPERTEAERTAVRAIEAPLIAEAARREAVRRRREEAFIGIVSKSNICIPFPINLQYCECWEGVSVDTAPSFLALGCMENADAFVLCAGGLLCVDREGIKDIRLLPSEIHVSVG